MLSFNDLVRWLKRGCHSRVKTIVRKRRFRLCLEELETRLAPALVWTGAAGNSNWSSPGNWQGGTIPTVGATVDLVFNSTATPYTANNDIAGLTVNSLEIAGLGSTVTISGVPITLGNPTTNTGQIIVNTSASAVISTDIQLGNTASSEEFINVQSGAALTLSGHLSGYSVAQLTMQGAGTLTLANDNNAFSGPFKIANSFEGGGNGIVAITNPKALGSATTSDLQTISISGASAGVTQFKLTYPNGTTNPTTAAITYNGTTADAGAIQTQLNSLFNGLGFTGIPVTVTRTASSAGSETFAVAFGGTMAGINVLEMTAATTAGSGTTSVGTLVSGGNPNFTTVTTNTQLQVNLTASGTINNPLVINGAGPGGNTGALYMNPSAQGPITATWAGNIQMNSENGVSNTTFDVANVTGLVTGVSNASPIVITTASTAQLYTGEKVSLFNVGGRAAGPWIITVVNATTFSLNGSAAGGGAGAGGGWMAAPYTLAITGQISNSSTSGYTVTKEGGGTLYLNPLNAAGNTYSGNTLVNAGTLSIGHPFALGPGGATTTTVVGSNSLESGTLAINYTNNAFIPAQYLVYAQVHKISLSGATAGTTKFTLNYNGAVTAPITYTGGAADAGAIQAALNGLATIGGTSGVGGIGASVTVTGSGTNFSVTFGGSLGGIFIPTMTAAVTAGPGTIAVSTAADTTQKIGFQVPNELLTLNGPGLEGVSVAFTNQSQFTPAVGGAYESTGALDNLAGANAWERPITFWSSAASIITQAGYYGNLSPIAIGVEGPTDHIPGTPYSNLTIDGVITDNNIGIAGTRYSFAKVGGGRLILTQANVFAASTDVLAGALNLRDSNAMGLNTGAIGGPEAWWGSSLELQTDNIPDSSGLAGLYNLYFPAIIPFFLNGPGWNNEGALFNMSGVNKIEGPVSLRSNTSIAVAPDPDPSNIQGQVFNDLSQLTIDGVIGSPLNPVTLKKVGFGELVLTNANTYTGPNIGRYPGVTPQTDIQQGWITVENNHALGGSASKTDSMNPVVNVAAGAALHLKQDLSGNNLQLAYNLALAGTGISHRFAWLNQHGALENLDGTNTVTGYVYLNGSVGLGVELDGANSPNPPVSELILSGIGTSGATIIDGTSAGTIVKVGSQRLVIEDPGTYTGGVDIKQGVVQTQNETALGTGTSAAPVTTTVESGTALEIAPTNPLLTGGLQRGQQIQNDHLILNGTGNTTFGEPPLAILSNDNLWRGPITLNAVANSAPIINVAPNARFIVTGVIDDGVAPALPADLIVSGGGELSLAGRNTYRGTTFINQGIVTISNDQALGVSTVISAVQTLTITAGTVFNLGFNGSSPTPNLTYSGTPADRSNIETALNNLSTIGGVGGSVVVTQAGNVFTVTFGGTLAGFKQNLLTKNVVGAGSVTVTALTDGRGGIAVANGAQLQMQGGITVSGKPLQIQGQGNPSVPDVQSLTIGGVAGAFSLSFTNPNPGGVTSTTSSLPAGASALQVQTALNQLASIQQGGGASGGFVTVNEPGSGVYTITFEGTFLGANNLPLLVANSTNGATAFVARLVQGGSPISIPTQWFSIGPAPINNGQLFTTTPATTGDVSGGVTGIVADPADPNNLYIATRGGGAWKTVNSGKTWTPLFDGVSAVETVKVTGISGTFTLNFTNPLTGVTFATPVLPFNAPADQVQAALNGLSSIGGNGGSVLVSEVTTPGVNEVQKLDLSVGGANLVAGATTFTLTFGGYTSPTQILYTNTPQDAINIQAVLNDPSFATVGGVGAFATVNQSAVGVFSIRFSGTLAQQPLTPNIVSATIVAGPLFGPVNATVLTAGVLPFNVYTITFSGGSLANVPLVPPPSASASLTAAGTNGATTAVAMIGNGVDPNAVIYSGAIALAPSDPATIYLGLGGGNIPAEAYYGTGVFVSHDHGQSWRLVTDATGNPLSRAAINKIVVDPQDPNFFYVAASDIPAGDPGGNAGIWRFDGTAWLNLTATALPGTATNSSWSDLLLLSNGTSASSRLYAALGDARGAPKNGVYTCTNPRAAAPTWTKTFNPAVAAGVVKISGAAGGAQNADTIFAQIADSSGGFSSLQVSTNGSTTWTPFAAPPANYLANRGGFASTIVAASSTLFYVGGTDSGTGHNFVLRAQGGAWTDISEDAASNGPHTGLHAMALDANGNLVVGSDGGVWRFANNTWSDLNGNLAITELLSVATNPNNPNNAIGGALYVGTFQFAGTSNWKAVDGGNGDWVAYDPNNANIAYHVQNKTLRKSTNGGSTWSSTGFTFTGNHMPFAVSSTSSNLFIGGQGLSFNGAGSTALYEWNGTSAPLDLRPPTNNIWALAISTNQGAFQADPAFPSVTDIGAGNPDSRTVYITDQSHIYVTKDLGLLQAGGLPGWSADRAPAGAQTIVDLAVDPTDRDTVYAISSGFTGTPGTRVVFKSTDAGRTWTDISAGLPDSPASRLAIDARYNNLYLATDRGVYELAGGVITSTNTWQRVGDFLPGAAVINLDLNQSLNILTAATFGRSAYQFYLDTATVNTGAFRAASGSDVWNGPIILTGQTTISAQGNQSLQNGVAAAQLTILGGISDLTPKALTTTLTNTLTKVGTGDIILAGSSIYAGVTVVKEGNLVVRNPNALGSPGTAGTQVLFFNNATAGVTQFNLSFNGSNTASPLTYAGVGGTSPGSDAQAIQTALNLLPSISAGGGSVNVTPDGSGAGFAITFAGPLANTNQPPINGTIVSGPGTSFTVNAGSTAVAAGAVLQLNTSLNAEPLYLFGNGVQNSGHFSGALENVNNNNTYNGVITLESNSTIGVDTGSTLTLTGPGTITDPGGPNGQFSLDKEGKGTLFLSTSNSYEGGTNVNQGDLNIQNNAALGAAGATTTVLDGAQLQLQAPTGSSGINVSTQNLVLSGTGDSGTGALFNVRGNNTWGSTTTGITLSVVPGFAAQTSPAGVVRIGVPNQADTLTIAGSIGEPLTQQQGDPQPPGTLPMASGLAKVGAGTLVLSQADTYSGTTYVTSGALDIQNSNALGLNTGQAVQRITTFDPGAADTFMLTFPPGPGGISTPALPFGAAAASVQTALNNLPAIGAGGVHVGSNIVYSGISEVQTLSLAGAVANTTQLQFAFKGSALSAPITYTGVVGGDSGDIANITAALNGLATIGGLPTPPGAGSVTVTADVTDTIFTITFGGSLQKSRQPLITASVSTGPGTSNVTETTAGVGGQSYVYTVTFVGASLAGPQPLIVAHGSSGLFTTAVSTVADAGVGALVSSGAALQIDSDPGHTGQTSPIVTPSSLPLALNGTGINNTGGLHNLSGHNTWQGLITLQSDSTIDVDPGSHLTLSGILQAPGQQALTKTGAGRLEINAIDASYTGTTRINQGDVQVDGMGATQVITLSAASAGTTNITLSYNGATSSPFTYSGNAATDTAAIQNALMTDLRIDPTQITSVTADATDTVFTIVFTSVVTAIMPAITSAPGTGFAYVNLPNNPNNLNAVFLNGGSLSGTGAVGNVTGNPSTTPVVGMLAPGVNQTTLSHGILNINGTLSLGSNSTLFVDLANLSNTHPNPIAGADYDQLAVHQSTVLDLGNTLLSGTSGAGVRVGDNFTILQTGGSISGFFRGDLTGAGSIGQVTDHVFIDGTRYSVQYNRSGNGSVVLTVVLVTLARTTTMVVSTSPTAPVYGQSVTLNATVTSLSGSVPIGGRVTFWDGQIGTPSGINLGFANIIDSEGHVSFTTDKLSAGTHRINAAYGGTPDNSFRASDTTASGFLDNFVVAPAQTATALSSNAAGNTSIAGQPVTFTATVTTQSPSTALVSAGAVTFTDNGVAIPGGPVNVNDNGVASVTVTYNGLGTHVIQAIYNPPSVAPINYVTSSSPPDTLTHSVLNSSQVNVSAVLANVYGQDLVYPITVTSSQGGTPSGVVTVTEGGNPVTYTALDLGGGAWTITITGGTLNQGTHSLVFTYTDTSATPGYVSSFKAISQVVAPAGTTVTFIPAPQTSIVYGAPVTYAGIVTGGGINPTAGTVKLYVDSTANAPFATATLSGDNTFSFDPGVSIPANFGVGNHTILATYTSADANFANSPAATSPLAITQAFTQVSQPISSVTDSPLGGSYYGQAVTFTVTVTTNSPITPTGGTVSFYLNTSTLLGTVNLGAGGVAGVASYTTTTAQLPVNTTTGDLITAVYNSSNPANPANANFRASDPSPAFPQMVSPAVITVAITSSSGSVNGVHQSGFGQSVTFTAVVTAATGGPPTTGAGVTLTFTDSTTGMVYTGVLVSTLTTATSVTYTFTTSTLSVNTALGHSIIATYTDNADNKFASPTPSDALIQIVTPATTSTVLTSSPSPTAWASDKPTTFTATVSLVSGTGTLTGGNVTFWDGPVGTGTILGTGTLNASGVATFTTTLTAGPHTITASYDGTDAIAGSTSNSQDNANVRKFSNLTLGVSANPTATQPTTFTATFMGVNGPLAGKTVTFTINGSTFTVVTDTSGVATLNYTFAVEGTYTVTASYSDPLDIYNDATNSITVTVRPRGR
jgi:autotransporter-associated beta strand protein